MDLLEHNTMRQTIATVCIRIMPFPWSTIQQRKWNDISADSTSLISKTIVSQTHVSNTIKYMLLVILNSCHKKIFSQT